MKTNFKMCPRWEYTCPCVKRAEMFWEGATWRSNPALHVGAVADLPGKGPQGSRGTAVGGGVHNWQGRGRWGGWEILGMGGSGMQMLSDSFIFWF